MQCMHVLRVYIVYKYVCAQSSSRNFQSATRKPSAPAYLRALRRIKRVVQRVVHGKRACCIVQVCLIIAYIVCMSANECVCMYLCRFTNCSYVGVSTYIIKPICKDACMTLHACVFNIITNETTLKCQYYYCSNHGTHWDTTMTYYIMYVSISMYVRG